MILKIQQRINDSIHLGKAISPFENIGDSKAIDRTASDFLNADQKVEKIKRLVNKGEYNKDVARYILGVLNLMYQGMLESITTREQPADSSYIGMQLQLLFANHYANPNSFHLCFSIKIKKTNKS